MNDTAITSDPHNFGRTVFCRGNWICKQRNMVWESLFLGDSGLRALIQHHVPLMSDGIDPFRLVPTLKFRNITINSGEVERFTASLSSIDPLTNEDQLALGAQIALWSYLGFGDLHWENILFGKKGDQFFFFPIDLEVASRDLLLPSHTWLLPDMAIPMEYCGLYKFLSFLKINLNPLLLVIGYYKALTCLTILGNEIDRELLDVHLSRPLLTRVIFRKTQTYHQLLKGGSSDVDLKCPLFSSEREQLLRGDIPYYFSYLERDGLYCYQQDMTPYEAEIICTRVKLHKIRKIRRGMFERHEHVGHLKIFGSLQIARTFIRHIRTSNFFQSDSSFTLARKGNKVFLKIPEGSFEVNI